MSFTSRCGVCLAFLFSWWGQARAANYEVAGLTGYKHGFELQAQGTVTEVFKNQPIGFALGIGYTFVDPGDALAARRIFINDATDGTPEKDGHVVDLRADVIFFFKFFDLKQVGIFFGPRYSMFTGHFRYVGGNEDFLVTANDWGVGIGLRGMKALSPRLGLVGAIGVDWFPVSSLYGHDTTYFSNAPPINPKGTYTWSDASGAINSPRFTPSILLGLNWRT